ncbi:hypothetical protein, partial [Mesorhizobium sp. M2E.F.Ca.ET.209.01.1.1]|uniref:FAD-binding oxidoreductase n=1 Tax=Mesorhizobium sp. M2E.F.Ca.ET.209.01.1.1 TaxID=2500526 RepID=UPI001FED46DF
MSRRALPNAGGTGVLVYGNARELCLGVEVVLPTGEVFDDLRKLKKDNTGYDLKNRKRARRISTV